MLNHPAVTLTPRRRLMAEVLAHHESRWWCPYCGVDLVPLGTLAAVAATVIKGGRIVAAPGFSWPSVDHKMPTSRGGTDQLGNLTVCCLPCNTRKGARTVEEFLRILSDEFDALEAAHGPVQFA